MKTNNDKQQSETYLAEWLAGTLSDAQFKQLVSETDFLAYAKLRDGIGSYTMAAPDMDDNYMKIRAKIDSRKSTKKPAVYKLIPYFSVAAAIALLFGLYNLLAFSNSENTGIGVKSTLTLADNSVVALNAQSSVAYPTLFNYNRKIKLNGEAFFDVEKGSRFCVATENGTVEVLGTQFNVLSRDGFFEVVCYEGQVKVFANDKSFILGKGDGVRLYDGKSEKWTESFIMQPTWISGESSFRNIPFEVLIEQFKSQYDYKIQFPKTVSQVKFSGTFSNSNLEMALRSICLPLNLEYTITDDRTIIISE